MNPLKIYNSLTRDKELFQPQNPPFVGLYVCGPTVYGAAHLGHARPYVTFDVLFRYLTFLGYKVRYVRNITDVGHLENDADEGEDKIAKKARLESLEPMEIAQRYTNNFHKAMELLGNLEPSIEPLASGHIIEQIEFVSNILNNGFGYEVNGSVYFDMQAYQKKHQYGILSGRIIEDLETSGRALDGQEEKKHPADFALWKQAKPEHIMRWQSPWGLGFPGWHIECSAMSAKYLGTHFDIHGGGMDLLFPHHECEIAQSVAGNNTQPVQYWMHCNMITINGRKMGKSLGNAISLEEFFEGSHPLLEQAYNPQTIRFFILQSQYRSTLDFSNQALQAAEKGLSRLLQANRKLEKIKATEGALHSPFITEWKQKCFDALNDDLNTAILIAQLFEATSYIYSLEEGKSTLNPTDLQQFKSDFNLFLSDILGLKAQENSSSAEQKAKQSALIELLLTQRSQAKANKDFQSADAIRNALTELGVVIKDSKEGTTWEWE